MATQLSTSPAVAQPQAVRSAVPEHFSRPITECSSTRGRTVSALDAQPLARRAAAVLAGAAGLGLRLPQRLQQAAARPDNPNSGEEQRQHQVRRR